MQKTDLELQEAIIEGMDDSHDEYMADNRERALGYFLEALTAHGYKIVKDTD